MVNFVGKYCYFIRVISGCDSPLIALKGKIASQRKTEKEFPCAYADVNLHYVFNDNVPLLQKSINWFALQMNELVSVWAEYCHKRGW